MIKPDILVMHHGFMFTIRCHEARAIPTHRDRLARVGKLYRAKYKYYSIYVVCYGGRERIDGALTIKRAKQVARRAGLRLRKESDEWKKQIKSTDTGCVLSVDNPVVAAVLGSSVTSVLRSMSEDTSVQHAKQLTDGETDEQTIVYHES